MRLRLLMSLLSSPAIHYSFLSLFFFVCACVYVASEDRALGKYVLLQFDFRKGERRRKEIRQKKMLNEEENDSHHLARVETKQRMWTSLSLSNNR